MMKGGIVVKPRARRDLVEIGGYIARDNPAAADRLIDEFTEKFELLAAFPGLGRVDDDRPDRRLFHAGAYTIIYREGDAGIEVLRVIHGRRDRQRL